MQINSTEEMFHVYLFRYIKKMFLQFKKRYFLLTNNQNYESVSKRGFY